MRNDAAALGFFAACDGAFHDAPCFIPTDPQQPGRSQDIGFQERVNCVTLKGQAETRSFQRPRNLYLPNAMKQTGHTRNSGMEPRQPRAMVQMSPLSKRDVVVQ